MKPIFKWAGGKRKLLPSIKEVIDFELLQGNTLYEPFVGGGALFLDLENDNIHINDLNSELINAYIQIKENPKKLIKLLRKYSINNSKEFYYKMRNYDRQKSFSRLSNVTKAARTIYLNRTCYNGLYRVNSQGKFNVPCGYYKKPDIILEEKIISLSEYLNRVSATITNLDFEEAVKDAKENDLVYFDPPYDYEKEGFTSYTSNGFSREDLRRLKRVCDELIERGCKVIISNNDTPFVNELFNDPKYIIKHVVTRWMISCDGKNRKEIKEVIIYG